MSHPLHRPAAPFESSETFAASFPNAGESTGEEMMVDQTADPQRDVAQCHSENISPITLLFEAQHEALKDDYRDASGKVIDCRDIALSFWKKIRNEGRRGRIVTLLGKDSQGNRVPLRPAPYEGRVQWAWHAICKDEEAGIAYDPILEKPTAMETYLATVFPQQKVEIEDRLPL